MGESYYGMEQSDLSIIDDFYSNGVSFICNETSFLDGVN